MSIIDRIPASVQPTSDTIDHADPFVPSAIDLECYAEWLASRSDLDVQAVEPTPIELLEPPADDDDAEPWYASLPTETELAEYLDTPIELGPVAVPVKVRPIPPSRFSSPDRYSTDVAGDPDRIADGYHVVDAITGQPVAWRRYLTDAKALASEMNLHDSPRSRPSWNPEADAIGRS